MGTVILLKQPVKSTSIAVAHGQRLAAQMLRELDEQYDTRDEDLEPADEIVEARIGGAVVGEYLEVARRSGNVFVEYTFLGVLAARLIAVAALYRDTEIRSAP